MRRPGASGVGYAFLPSLLVLASCQAILELTHDNSTKQVDSAGAGGDSGGPASVNETQVGGLAQSEGAAGTAGNVALVPDLTPPLVLTVEPLHQSTTALLNASVRVEFSEPLDPMTISAESFSLRDAAGAVDAVLEYSGTAATLTPKHSLRPRTRHTVTLSTKITDLSGNPLQAQFYWNFETTSGTWAPSVELRSESTQALNQPKVAIERQGGSGYAVVAWTEERQTDAKLWARVHVPSQWLAPAPLDVTVVGGWSPELAYFSTHNVLAVWQATDAGRGTARFAYFAGRELVGSKWSTDTKISGKASSVSAPQLAGIGNSAVSVWTSLEEGVHTLTLREYTGSWGGELAIAQSEAEIAAPHASVNLRGDAVLVWAQMTGANSKIWSSNRRDGMWSEPMPIEGLAGRSLMPRVAMADNGDAVVAFRVHGASATKVWAARYAKGVWQKPEELGIVDEGETPMLDVGSDARGNGVVVWRGPTEIKRRVLASHYGDGAWSPAAPIDDGSGLRDTPVLSMNEHGKAVAIWNSGTEASNVVWANQFDTGKWLGAVPLSGAIPDQQTFFPQVALNGDGFAYAVWVQKRAGKWSLWSSLLY